MVKIRLRRLLLSTGSTTFPDPRVEA